MLHVCETLRGPCSCMKHYAITQTVFEGGVLDARGGANDEPPFLVVCTLLWAFGETRLGTSSQGVCYIITPG